MWTLQSPFASASLTQGPPNSSFPFNVCLSSTDLSYQYQSHCGWGASQVAAVNRAALTVKLSTTRKIKTTASANKHWESQSDKNRVKHPQLMRVRDGEQCEEGADTQEHWLRTAVWISQRDPVHIGAWPMNTFVYCFQL